MQVTYIGHSGFLVELESTVLLFDYYTGTIPSVDPSKEFFVFSSHNHHDHFNMEIFSLAEQYPQVHYILSDDIRHKFNQNFFLRHGVSEVLYQEIQFVEEHKTIEIPMETKKQSIRVETLHSTDEGVAFLVTAEEKEIYHAGDLNWWTWEGESPVENERMVADYKKEIDRIQGQHFDVAFVVLDSRQGADFWRGFDYFMTRTDTDLVYPMHYWGDDSVINRIKKMPEAADYANKIVGRENHMERSWNS